MSKISKTARASSVVETKAKQVETTEEAIKAIRDNLAAGLFIGDMSRVRKLLAAYDEIDQIATKAETDLAIAEADLDRLRLSIARGDYSAPPQPASESFPEHTGTAAMEG